MIDSMKEILSLESSEAISSIISFLNSDQNKSTVILRGNSGTGKSFIARKLEERWKSSNEKNQALYVTGDEALFERKYYPFVNALKRVKEDKTLTKHIHRGASELSKGIPFVGDFVSFLVDTIGNSKNSAQQESLRYLNDSEKVLVYDIESTFANSNLLLIVDNLQWMDDRSLYFLNLVLSDDLKLYKSLQRVKVVLVITDNQEVIAQQEFDQVLSHPISWAISIKSIQIDNYAEALKRFGFVGTLDFLLLKSLFSLTGGHLILIKRLSEYLQNEALSVSDLLEESNDSRDQFIENLLLYKLRDLGVKGESIYDLLECASVIGMSFKNEELVCLRNSKKEEIEELIQTSKDVSLIEEGSKRSFTHEIIRRFFLNRLQSKRLSYYTSFAACLAKIRPGDYLTRARFLFDGGDIKSAMVQYVLASLKNTRDGVRTDEQTKKRLDSFCSDFKLDDFYSAILSGYTLFLKGKYSETIQVLEKLEDHYPKQLLAEKYYLLSLCRIKTMTTADLRLAKSELSGWNELKNEEGELWTRMMTSLMIIEANLYDFNSARSTEKEISIYISNRMEYDSKAEYNLNVIRRISASTYSHEIACERTKKCVEFFTSQIQNSEPAFPFQLYYSLTNHSANLLAQGDYREAFEMSARALSIINEYKYTSFPEPQIPSNNYIISGVLSEEVPAADALKMFNVIPKYKEFAADEILIRNNYAIVMIHNNQIREGLALLEEVYGTTKSRELDIYYSYVSGVNLASAYYIIGQEEKSRTLWGELLNLLPNVPDREYLAKRHKLLQESLGKIEKNWKTWDSYLLEQFPNTLGKAWSFYGRGFLFSDIQLWSET